MLQPREHVVVAIRERITLTEGFVADFFPASACIEKGLVLVAGRLDANYEHAIVFGVFNASAVEVQLDPTKQLARITFGWLGNDNRPNYSGFKPGAYIDRIADLRKTE